MCLVSFTNYPFSESTWLEFELVRANRIFEYLVVYIEKKEVDGLYSFQDEKECLFEVIDGSKLRENAGVAASQYTRVA